MAVQIDHQEQYREVSQRVLFKFGGTVVGKFAPEIARICLYMSALLLRQLASLNSLFFRSSVFQKQNVAIVCSARSGKTKAEGTTNRYAAHFLASYLILPGRSYLESLP